MPVVYLSYVADGPLQFEGARNRMTSALGYIPFMYFAYEEDYSNPGVWKSRFLEPSPQLYIFKRKGKYQYRDYSWVNNYLKR